MDIRSLVLQMEADGTLARLQGNTAVQFGIPQRPYLGATILPERTVPDNRFSEAGIRYQTVIANDGSRYSPAQKKDGGELIGSFEVILGDQDISRELTGRDHDGLLQLLNRDASLDATAVVMRFVDQLVMRALVERTELQRWQALVSASVARVGDNGFAETITYPNPSGHRAAAGGTWSSNAYDPWADIVAMVDLLAGKGYTVNRIVTSTAVRNILLRNTNMILRMGRFIRISDTVQMTQRAAQGDLTQMMGAEGFPDIETYDLVYRTQDGTTARFLASGTMVFLATTGQDEQIQLAAGDRFLTDTLGYTAIGRAVGQQAPGRVIKLFPFEDKPPRLVVEGWQTSLPVVTAPEAIACITGIA